MNMHCALISGCVFGAECIECEEISDVEDDLDTTYLVSIDLLFFRVVLDFD